GGGGRGGAGQAAAAPERVRIVADPSANSVIVRAAPLDMLTVHRLIRELDTEDHDNLVVLKSHYVGPLKYAQASDVAQVIQNVYREQMGQRPTATQVGGMPGFGFPGFGRSAFGMTTGQTPTTTKVTLSVGVDDRNNSLVLMCSDALKED